MQSDRATRGRATEILSSLDELDVTGGSYPSDVTEHDDRLRWNQSRLVALAFYHAFEPTMLAGEYRQELYMLAGSIYRQDTRVFHTGTTDELATEITDALVRGWI